MLGRPVKGCPEIVVKAQVYFRHAALGGGFIDNKFMCFAEFRNSIMLLFAASHFINKSKYLLTKKMHHNSLRLVVSFTMAMLYLIKTLSQW